MAPYISKKQSLRPGEGSVFSQKVPGQVRLEQLGPELGVYTSPAHRITTDGLLLSEFAAPRREERACDLGSGCGIVAARWFLSPQSAPVRVDAVELQPEGVALMARAVAEGWLPAGRFFPVAADLRQLSLPAGAYGLVVCNPPYFPVGMGRDTASPTRQLARQEAACTLEEVCRAAARLLKTGGRFCLCLPPRRLAEALALLEGAGISPKRLQLVQHRPGRAPFLVLLEGRRGGRPGLEVLSTRMLAGEKEGNG